MERLEKSITREILSFVMDKGEFIIPDIVERTGYSATTVSKYLDELIRKGKIEARSSMATGSRGRKPIVYGAIDGRRNFLGVDIRYDAISMMLMSFSGKIEGKIKDYAYQYENSANKIEEICLQVEEFLKSEGKAPSDILGCCVVMGGRINSSKGTSASRFWFEELGDTPLADYLSERLGFPVMLENDSKAMAVAEHANLTKKVDDMLFINFGWGMGLGIIINGEIYHGHSGYSGEFGHIHAYDNNIICQCGKKGCLETEISGSAIQRKLTERLKNGERSILAAKYRKGEQITLQDILNACEKEDEMCIDEITRTGVELGYKISDLINIFNPETIVIGGLLSKVASYYLILPVESSIRKYSLKLISKGVSILPSTLGIESGSLGGCLLARKKYMEAGEL